ncbi:glycosyl transferase [Burkholderia sp. PAMC 28687]|uniref:lipopolysaccharide heptosyltransferase II n=1 Tax=Burkholderia sp. PAMC 28687 TaxID=1795874 RepID=UPI0007827BCE|nr:glycosyl transferase [Burkholderia sp. PAMC 28687]
MKQGPMVNIVIESHARAPATRSAQPWGDNIKRILCIRLDNLGDVLMTTPALHALRTSAPGRHITLLASRSGAQAARYIDDVDNVIEYEAPWVKNNRTANAATDLDMRSHLQAEGFDAAVIFTVYSQNPMPAAMLCHLAGIPRRLAHCRENPYALLTDWVAEPEPQTGTRHEVERQLALVQHVGAHSNNTRMHFDVRPDDIDSLAIKLADRGLSIDEPFITMHPGATAASRRYPAERFAQAAAQLADTTGWPVLITGGPDEAEVCTQAGGSHWMTVNLAGVLELGELAALIARTKVLISNNSGPVHIASALGTPVVDLYALTNPQHTPWQTPHRVLHHDVPCRWCYRSVCPEGHHACLTGVPVEQLVSAAMQLLHDEPVSTATQATFATS